MTSWLLSHQQIMSEQFNYKKLPHAIIINGVTGAGKLALAQWLIGLISCQQPQQSPNKTGVIESCGQCKSCLLLKSTTYPDHLNLIAEKNSLGVDDIRHANIFLQKTAYLGNYKTIVIEHAETMTQAAANALLKTLEEPNGNSVILLLTNDIDMLLATIISRCRILNIRPEVGQALLSNLSVNPLNTDINTRFVNLSQLPELTDSTLNEAFHAVKTCYLHYLDDQQVELQLLALLLKNEHGLRWLEQITANLYRDKIMTVATDLNNIALTPEVLNNLYKVIINGCKVIKSYTQANKQFVCEQLIMAISKVLEQAKVTE